MRSVLRSLCGGGSVLLLVAGLLTLPFLLPSAHAATLTASDDFNRADGALGSNWTAMSDGAMTISSQVVAGGNSGQSGDMRTAETYTSDQYSQVQVTSTQLTGGQWIGPVVRSQSNSNLYVGIYFWNGGSPQLRLYKRTSGSWIQLGSSYSIGQLAAGETLRLTATGSTISFLLDGSPVITVTDTSLTGGAPGIMAYGTARADNWAGGNIGGGASYTIGGTVSGLSGTVVLQDNGGDNLSVTANGSFAFPTQLAGGAAYAVTVKTQPSGQTCTVGSGTGTVGSANITNVAVTCTTSPPVTYSVGGTVSGLSGTVVLQDNGGDNLSVTANGSFAFPTQLAGGAAYAVTVKTQPSGQTCTVGSGTGTVGSANITNVAVTCTTSPPVTYSVGGTVSGLSGTVVLQDNGGDNLSVTANGSFAFPTQLAGGAAYAVTVKTQPSGQTCTVGSGTGTVGSANITNVAVTCTTSGGSGTLTASDDFNRADGALGSNWTAMSDGAMTISSQVVAGGNSGQSGDTRTAETYTSDQYSQVQVTSTQLTGGQWIGPVVRSQSNSNLYVGIYFWNGGSPQLRLYKRTSGSWIQLGSSYSIGQLAAGETLRLTATGSTISFLLDGSPVITVTDTSLTGGAPGIMAYGTARADNWAGGNIGGGASYTIGGTVSGLSGTVVLQDNGGDNLSVTANGSFAFPTQLAGGAAYAVTVKTQPSGQTCTVGSGTGTVGSANITNVAVTCTTSPPVTYSVGGTVSGLSGTVVLQDNGGDDLSVTANGSFAFPTQLAGGAAYAVTVKTQPSGQTCTVGSGTGTVGSANITNVAVTCTTSGGSGTLTASDDFNRADGALGSNWTAMSDGAMTISSQVVAGGNSGQSGDTRTAETYTSDQYSQVQVTSTQLTGGQWIGPVVRSQSNSNLYVGIYFWNGGSPQLRLYKRTSGSWIQLGSSYSIGQLAAGETLRLTATGSTISFLLDGSPVITVTDTSLTGGAPGIMAYGTARADNWAGGNIGGGASYTIGGTVSGLSGTVVLQDNGGDNLSVTANGSFAFPTQLAGGAAYAVTVKTQPSGQTCTVGSGTGTVGSANITNVAVTCTTSPPVTYSVGGTVSGLSGTVVLQDNGGDNLSVTANGSFAFPTQLAGGAAYAVTVKTQPSGQTCTVGSGTGTVGSANITNVAVTCTTSPPVTYSVGGTVSGLSGTVVLQDNGGDNLSVTANGSFAFPTQLAGGAAYAVTVKTQPSGQTCTVGSGTGTVGSANITNVAVTCTASSGGGSGLQVQYLSTDASGVQTYQVTSPDNGPGPQNLRILQPSNPAPGVAHNFIYVLPIEPGDDGGLQVIQSLNLQNQYNLTVIEPSFSISPWYADNPLDANLQEDTFMAMDLQPWVKANLSTTGSEQHWLIGFSKSGIGAQTLILRHPDKFTLAASWDFPADMSAYDQYGTNSSASYGTDANFQANYRLTAAFLAAHAAPFKTNNRIWIGGYQLFQQDMADYDALLTAQGIRHTTETPTAMAHAWDSGWVPTALSALSAESANLN